MANAASVRIFTVCQPDCQATSSPKQSSFGYMLILCRIIHGSHTDEQSKIQYLFQTIFDTMFGGKCSLKVELQNTAFQNPSTVTVPADNYIAHPIPSFG